jgi:hypothetical protein
VISSAAPLPTDTESCAVVTVTVIETSVKPSVPVAPYPTGPAGTGVPISVPSRTGVYTSALPEFTGAAAAVKIPAGIVGFLGVIAYLL